MIEKSAEDIEKGSFVLNMDGAFLMESFTIQSYK